MSDIEDAYFAGLFDGEGSVYIDVWGKTQKRIAIKINMTDFDTVKSFAKYIGSNVSIRSAANDRCKDQLCARTTGDKAISALRRMLPYMRTKKSRALECILIHESRPKLPRGRPPKIHR